MENKKIAIIGGGFSGLAVAYNLLQLNQKIIIDVFDEENFQNNGKAYQTTDINHILNVPADKMGLPFDDEDHFYNWLSNFIIIDKNSFVSRRFYRLYLQEIIAKLQKEQAINFINNQICNVQFIDEKYFLYSKDNLVGQYDFVVVACGLGCKKLPINFESDKIVNDIWNFFNQFTASNKYLIKYKTILIVGTGLTMIDAVLSFKNSGFKGKIIACSGSGKLPLPHLPTKSEEHNTLKTVDAKLPLSQILFNLKKAGKNAQNWQSVIQGLRNITSEIWQEFSLYKKRQFIRHLMGFWNIHRHRVAKNNNDQIIKMIQDGELEIVKGRLRKIEKNNQQIIATLNNDKIIVADLVLNAMGFDFSGKENALLNNLLQANIISYHPTKLGFQVLENHSNFYLCGSLLAGEFLEITAVPELRVMAYKIALKILKSYENSGV
jgi:uncharacterized NAD(P)/FAD-binding protein YdhS